MFVAVVVCGVDNFRDSYGDGDADVSDAAVALLPVQGILNIYLISVDRSAAQKSVLLQLWQPIKNKEQREEERQDKRKEGNEEQAGHKGAS
ncbi:unnamed protein product [Enterobius vermicularis]|uniref:Uncharacterized protein n=1 Tax=Enterobius vermicularis TaxID=51028 RepID=A0A0N4VF36_ENTVE|nr:unnamed protein product [Enterobius vermicularis]